MQHQRSSAPSNGTAVDPFDDTSEGELFVVSNRQPYRHTRDEDGVSVDQPTGGLTAGMDPVMQRLGGTWIAWGDGDADRAAVDDDDCVSVPPDESAYTLRRVWLSADAVEGYYHGFSNQVLWPLSHSMPGVVSYEPSFWATYRRVNEAFADAVVDQATDSPTVWLQDYHLALAPALVRDRLADAATILQFWHVPWPRWEVFRQAPRAEALLDGLLGNDVLGFHVPRYCRHFLTCVDRALPSASVDHSGGRVHYRGRTTSVDAVPLGVPVDDVREAAESRTARQFPASFRAAHDVAPDTRLAIGVDRIDYTKGIPARLRALERLWETTDRFRGSLTYVQKGSVSRSAVPAYQRIQERVRSLVDRINDRFGTPTWQPIVYTTEMLPRAELIGLYREADVAIVSPIRDGMNLVAQEYAAAQTEDDGVLVLSEGAGAHDVMGEHALSVRPALVDEFADAIRRALTMPRHERTARMAALRRSVREHALSTWISRFLGRNWSDQTVSSQ
jgi:trehalose 6-phosphate synthase